MGPIDLNEVIKKKDPKLAKRLPKFVIKLIGRIVHIDEINAVLAKYGHLNGVDFVDGTLEYLNSTCEVNILNPDSFKQGERYIFVSNHPLGGLDGLTITTEINKRFGPAKFLVNDILMNVEPLQDVFVPVNNLGKSGSEELKGVKEIYNSDFHVLNFPSGACSRLIKGKITDLEWKKSFVREAIKSKRIIVPMHFDGKNSKLFYWTSKIRMALGIKAFIEMFLLPREMFRQKNKTFRLTIGEPISYTEIENSGKTAQQWCDIIRERVYNYGKSNRGNR